MASTTTHYEYLGNNTYIHRKTTYNIEQNKNHIYKYIIQYIYRKERLRDIHEKWIIKEGPIRRNVIDSSPGII